VTQISIENPECTKCGYNLYGITSANCPECGHDIVSDPSFRTPSLIATPWSRWKPRPLAFGIAAVVAAPLKTLRHCDSPQRVTVTRAILFAAMVMGLLVGLWPLIKETGLTIAVATTSATWSLNDAASYLPKELSKPRLWRINCGWELWSVTRWWLLFGLIVFIFPDHSHRQNIRSPHQIHLCRLMLFAPWIAILELGHLFGVWFVDQTVVPEPSTIFAMWPVSLTTMWTNSIWLTRAVVPTFFVGLVFARAVTGWRWPIALLFAMTLVPVGMLLSVTWSCLFTSSEVIDLVYGR
jgi:hypothetical protein